MGTHARGGRCRPFTLQEAQTLREKLPLGRRERAMFEALISSGARIGEILALDVEDVLAPGSVVREMVRLHTPKQARKSRWAALAPNARDAIAAYLETRTTGPLFLSVETCGRGGGRLSPKRAWSLWKSIFAALGFDTLGLATHSFRKTFVDLRRRAGWSTADMMQATGHAHLASFEKYIQVGVEEMAARNEAILAVLDREADVQAEGEF